MINRQRFGIFLLTSALVGGFMLPVAAAEFTPAPGTAAPAAAAPAPVAASPAPIAAAPAPIVATPTRAPASVAAPAKVARAVPTTHAKHKIIARIRPPSELVQPRPQEYEVASTASANVQCRICGYPVIFGIAY
jgi:hypothetical protein